MRRFAPALLLLASCAHWFSVSPAQVQEYAEAQAYGPFQATDGTATFAVQQDDHPRLRLHFLGCAAHRNKDGACAEDVETSLRSVRFLDPERFSFLQGDTGRRRNWFTARVGDLQAAQMSFEGYRPPGWRPTWGLGLLFGGPGIGPAFALTFLPWRWLAFDAGGSAVTWVGYGGARVRLVNATAAAPFLGAFINTGVAVGGRAGIDVELFARQIWLSAELDVGRVLANPLSYSYELARLGRTGFLWGGVAVSYFL